MQRSVTTIIAIGVGFAGVAPPPERRGRAGARGIFPLRLARQPVLAAGLAAEPGRERPGVLPGDIDHRLIAAAPAVIVRPILAARVRYAGVPLIEGDFAPLDRKRLGDRHLV